MFFHVQKEAGWPCSWQEIMVIVVAQQVKNGPSANRISAWQENQMSPALFPLSRGRGFREAKLKFFYGGVSWVSFRAEGVLGDKERL